VRSPSAFPGSGTASPPGGETGDHLEQFETPNSLQCDAGKAPVIRRSGKGELVVAHRLACNRHLADAVQQWAFCSISRSTWGREFYDAQRARGKGHHAALRALGNRWLEVLWHCSAAASPPPRPSPSPTATGRSAKRPEPSTVELQFVVDGGCPTSPSRSAGVTRRRTVPAWPRPWDPHPVRHKEGLLCPVLGRPWSRAQKLVSASVISRTRSSSPSPSSIITKPRPCAESAAPTSSAFIRRRRSRGSTTTVETLGSASNRRSLGREPFLPEPTSASMGTAGCPVDWLRIGPCPILRLSRPAPSPARGHTAPSLPPARPLANPSSDRDRDPDPRRLAHLPHRRAGRRLRRHPGHLCLRALLYEL
jgi:hypothetical protein